MFAVKSARNSPSPSSRSIRESVRRSASEAKGLIPTFVVPDLPRISSPNNQAVVWSVDTRFMQDRRALMRKDCGVPSSSNLESRGDDNGTN